MPDLYVLDTLPQGSDHHPQLLEPLRVHHSNERRVVLFRLKNPDTARSIANRDGLDLFTNRRAANAAFDEAVTGG